VDVPDASQCGADIASRFAPPALGLFLATPESDLAAKAFAVIGDHFPALVDVLLLVFEEGLLCQSVDCDCDNATTGGFHAHSKAFCFAERKRPIASGSGRTGPDWPGRAIRAKNLASSSILSRVLKFDFCSSLYQHLPFKSRDFRPSSPSTSPKNFHML
jgi:hypothetical protein